MTTEVLVQMLDAAKDRKDAEYEQRVDEMRISWIFSQGKEGQKAYERWKVKVRRTVGAVRRSAALSGAALEHAIRGLAVTNPEYVVVQ